MVSVNSAMFRVSVPSSSKSLRDTAVCDREASNEEHAGHASGVIEKLLTFL